MPDLGLYLLYLKIRYIKTLNKWSVEETCTLVAKLIEDFGVGFSYFSFRLDLSTDFELEIVFFEMGVSSVSSV